jgi:ribosomal subunit interface protein
MDVLIHADGFSLGDAQKDAVEEKIGRLEHYEPRALRARVHLRRTSAHQSETQFQVKVLMEVPGHDVSAEETASQPIEAVDLLVEKLEHRLARRKTERLARRTAEAGLGEQAGV